MSIRFSILLVLVSGTSFLGTVSFGNAWGLPMAAITLLALLFALRTLQFSYRSVTIFGSSQKHFRKKRP